MTETFIFFPLAGGDAPLVASCYCCYIRDIADKSAYPTVDSLPFPRESFRDEDRDTFLPARPALRSPKFVSLAASVYVVEEPDFASKARIAGIPMDPFGALCSFFIAVYRTISLIESTVLDFFLACDSSSDPWSASESDVSNSRLSDWLSLRDLLNPLPFDIGGKKTSKPVVGVAAREGAGSGSITTPNWET